MTAPFRTLAALVAVASGRGAADAHAHARGSPTALADDSATGAWYLCEN